jgi:hypothetical protein
MKRLGSPPTAWSGGCVPPFDTAFKSVVEILIIGLPNISGRAARQPESWVIQKSVAGENNTVNPRLYWLFSTNLILHIGPLSVVCPDMSSFAGEL